MNNSLSIKDLVMVFGEKTVLDHISFDVRAGEFLSVLGPSGCGKTTLLRILVGITSQTSGTIYKGEEDISFLEPDKRGMGIVFQNYALFPNMTVLKNVEYSLAIRKDHDKKSARKKALEVIEQVGMIEHLDKKPVQLSGGQQQRVAIARTLALNPEIILFDEPMSALDAANRLTLRDELKRIQKEYSATMIYITHDQEEAFTLSDRIMVMSYGRIEQLDTPDVIFHQPANDYVEEFVVEHLEKKLSSLAHTMGMEYRKAEGAEK